MLQPLVANSNVTMEDWEATKVLVSDHTSILRSGYVRCAVGEGDGGGVTHI